MEDAQMSGISKSILTEMCLDFCRIIKDELKVETGIYANLDWFRNKLDINKLSEYKIWLAEWNNNNNHSADFKVDLWQYTSKGKINGINTNVDISNCLNCQTSEGVKPVETEEDVINRIKSFAYGTGLDLINNMKKDGYSNNFIKYILNKIIDNILNSSSIETEEDVINRIIAGFYGNGQDRIDNMKKAGYSDNFIKYIQNKVNLVLNSKS